MASACLNRIGISPENLLECSQKYSSSYNWFSHRLSTESKTKKQLSSPVNNLSDPSEKLDLAKQVSDLTEEQDPTEFDGFEFRLDGSVMMLPADELFSDGKLVPLQLSVSHNDEPATSSSTTVATTTVKTPDTPCSHRRSTDDVFSVAGDPYLFSPRAPRCTSRWKELLGFRKVTGANATSNGCNNTSSTDNNSKRSSISSSHNNNSSSRSSIRQLLHRSSKSAAYDSSTINFPLLKEAETTESVSVSSRHSLSSSSSGHDLDDLPRLSLDLDKQPGKINLNLNPNTRPKTRMVKTNQTTEARNYSNRVNRNSIRRSSETAAAAAAATNRGGVSIDSPRMNSSGKIVFHSLERSSSSPSSFNGGPRFKHRGMERSYSANVRITPVLNVPVCSKSGSMFGFPIFSSQQKQQREGCGSSNNGGLSNRSQKFNGNNR